MKKLGLLVQHAPRTTLLVCLLLTALASLGLFQLSLSSDTRVFFGPQSPELQELQGFERKYGASNNVLMVVWAGGKPVSDPATLKAIGDLTARAWKLPHSMRVESLTNFPHVTSDADNFSVVELVPDPAHVTAQEATRIEQTALADPLLRGRLIAVDGRASGVLIDFNLPTEASSEVRSIIRACRELARDIERAHPGVEVKLTGNVMLMGTFEEAALADMKLLIPLSVLVTALIMIFFVRSLVLSAAILSLLALSSIASMGLAGLAGHVINTATVASPIIVMTVGMAAAVRIVTNAMNNRARGLPKHQAIAEAIAANLWPVTLTNGTTLVGFLSMNLAESPPLRELGNIVAAGIVLAYLLTFTWLPAALAMLPLKPRIERSERLMVRLGKFVNAHWRWLLLFTSLVVVVSSFWLTRITLDDDFARYFDSRFEYRQDSDFAEAHLTGLSLLEFDLKSGKESGVYDPTYQRNLAAFAEWLRVQPDVVSVVSVADITQRIARAARPGEGAGLPGDANEIAQYFLLYELSLPYGASLNSLISVDRSASRLTVIMRYATSSRIRELNAQAYDWLRLHAQPAMQQHATGINVIFSTLSAVNIRSMIWSTIMSMLLIAGVVAIALRSVGYGILSIFMNVLPSIVGFGLWGLLFGQIGLAASVITAMTIGLVVDDTIYFLIIYQAARQRGLSTEDAITHVFENVGVAMLVITASLTVGFGVLILSGFEVMRALGAQTAIVIAANLFIDWLMLPPLLRLWDSRKRVLKQAD